MTGKQYSPSVISRRITTKVDRKVISVEPTIYPDVWQLNLVCGHSKRVIKQGVYAVSKCDSCSSEMREKMNVKEVA